MQWRADTHSTNSWVLSMLVETVLVLRARHMGGRARGG